MDAAAAGFLLWSLFLFLMFIVFAYSAWHADSVDEKTEDTAEKCLPEIGRIAEKQFRRRTGSVPPGEKWYPELKVGGQKK